ncbi:MAG: ABC transporter ATP-binding protein [Chloroflexi bacterium]|nr:ABC transporter ATP-binding protein [Chloroflexota bacterium]
MPPPLVILQQVSRVYHLGPVRVSALDSVDLELQPGEFVVVLGPSGSGKTTLLNVIGGLDSPTAGRVVVDGMDITRSNEARLTQFRRRKIGFVFQFFNLLPNLTARENVELAAALAGTQRLIDRVMDDVGLTRQSRQFPGQLSGGEQQRVAVARALVTDAPLVLCDEPTGNLDFATGRRILKLMTDISRQTGKTFVVVTHNAAIGRVAHRVLHLRDGRIVQEKDNFEPIDPERLEW